MTIYMSWLGGYKPSSSKNSVTESREARRKKLEAEQAERIKRAEARAKQRKLLQAAVQARQEADQAIKELCEIDPDIFEGESAASGDISSDILNDTDKEDQVVIMADFDQENGTDGEKALEKMSQIQCPFNVSDLDFWFVELEGQLELIEIKSQWSKRMALQKLLPLKIKEEVKSLLRITKTRSGNDIYFRLKQELLDLFGKKPEDDYIQAKNRVLSGKPSQLGKKLIDDICPGDVKLQGCHCAKTVWAMFRGQLPVVIRNHISEMTFSKDTYKAVFAKADLVWNVEGSTIGNRQARISKY